MCASLGFPKRHSGALGTKGKLFEQGVLLDHTIDMGEAHHQGIPREKPSGRKEERSQLLLNNAINRPAFELQIVRRGIPPKALKRGEP